MYHQVLEVSAEKQSPKPSEHQSVKIRFWDIIFRKTHFFDGCSQVCEEGGKGGGGL